MKLNISSFTSGFIFGLGLIIAQMTNPVKVLAFLDVAGNWDPTLAFVMAGALLTFGILHLIINKRLAQSAETTPKSKIDTKLITGSSLFGIGWGLSGLCPGPALISLTSGLVGSYVFVVALFIGFALFRLLHRSS